MMIPASTSGSQGPHAACRLEAEVPSIGFSWKSDPLNTSKRAFAIVGEEVKVVTTAIDELDPAR